MLGIDTEALSSPAMAHTVVAGDSSSLLFHPRKEPQH